MCWKRAKTNLVSRAAEKKSKRWICFAQNFFFCRKSRALSFAPILNAALLLLICSFRTFCNEKVVEMLESNFASELQRAVCSRLFSNAALQHAFREFCSWRDTYLRAQPTVTKRIEEYSGKLRNTLGHVIDGWWIIIGRICIFGLLICLLNFT